MDAGRTRVSIIIPVFNAAQTLAQACESVRAQSLPDWEAILVNDGSTDGSPALMARIAAADPRFRCIDSSGPKGAAPARNAGLRAARGRYVAFLDADDQWHPRKLDLQLAEMDRTGIPLSFTAYRRVSARAQSSTVIGVPDRVTRAELLKTNVMACSTVVYDQSVFGLRRMPEIDRSHDFALWLELLQDTPAALGLPYVLMTYAQHDASLSANKARSAAGTWSVYRQAAGLSPGASLWYFSHYALRGLARQRFPTVARRMGWLRDAAALKDAE